MSRILLVPFNWYLNIFLYNEYYEDSGVDVTADAISAVVAASGNKIPGYYATVFASYIEKAGGLEPFMAAPSGGGGGGGAPAASAGGDAAPAEAPKPKEEEVDALDGGMDMFGGGGADY